jgi:hypothetical protein
VECNQTVKGCSLHCHYLLYISGAERLKERKEEEERKKKRWKTKQMIRSQGSAADMKALM